MTNWNELNNYAQTKVETRRQEAEEWRLGRLAQEHAQEAQTGAGARLSLPQILSGLLVRLRVIWLGA